MSHLLNVFEGEREKPYSRYVRALLRSCDPPLPDLTAVASRLHISDRTLNRRLQKEQTSFRQIRGEILGNWAREHLLHTGASVEAIAAELGYQDAANFRRAFRTREGCSPMEFRRRSLPEFATTSPIA